MSEFGPEDMGSDIDPETGNFIKKPEVNQQPTTPETERSVDFAMIEQSLNDGTGPEIAEETGGIAVETLLEEQGREETYGQLSTQDQEQTKVLFSNFATQNRLRLESTSDYCIAMAA